MIQIRREEGSAVVEFISLMILLIIPVVFYFTLITIKAGGSLKDGSILREVSEIIKSVSDFQESNSLAQRYISLRSGESSLVISCISGDCPHRDSVMNIELRTAGRITNRIIKGGKWQ